MPLLNFNLFRIIADKPETNAIRIESYDTYLINSLRRSNYLAGGISSDYGNDKRGTYVVLQPNQQEDKLRELIGGAANTGIILRTNSYVMRFIIYDAIALSLSRLSMNDSIFLPSKWDSYGELVFCSSDLWSKSKPNGLFNVRRCCYLRVEHVDEELYLQVDVKHRKFSNLKLTGLAEIIGEKGLSNDIFTNLKCSVTSEDGRRHQGYIIAVNHGQVNVRTQQGNISVKPENVSLNPTFYDVRDFISNQIGENLTDIENMIRREISYPSDTMRKIEANVKQIKNLIFPLEIGDARFTVDENPKQLDIPSVDIQGVNM